MKKTMLVCVACFIFFTAGCGEDKKNEEMIRKILKTEETEREKTAEQKKDDLEKVEQRIMNKIRDEEKKKQENTEKLKNDLEKIKKEIAKEVSDEILGPFKKQEEETKKMQEVLKKMERDFLKKVQEEVREEVKKSLDNLKPKEKENKEESKRPKQEEEPAAVFLNEAEKNKEVRLLMLKFQREKLEFDKKLRAFNRNDRFLHRSLTGKSRVKQNEIMQTREEKLKKLQEEAVELQFRFETAKADLDAKIARSEINDDPKKVSYSWFPRS